MDECVYHYCSLDIFDKIISNKTLRMTDVGCMNDSGEVVHIVPTVRRILSEYFKEYSEERVTNAIDSAINHILGPDGGNFISLATCFSDNPDLLSQWRGYGNDGMGVSIGFDRSVLKQIAQSYSLLDFSKVHYTQKAQESFIKKSMVRAIQTIQNMKIDSDAALRITIQTMVDYIFQQGGVFFKRSDFCEEKESRLTLTACSSFGGLTTLDHPILMIHDEHSVYSVVGNDFISLTDLSYFLRSNTMVKYVDLDFSKVADKLIKKITVGPKSHVSESDIRFMLKKNGFSVFHELYNYSDISSSLRGDNKYSVTVATSKCTYR